MNQYPLVFIPKEIAKAKPEPIPKPKLTKPIAPKQPKPPQSPVPKPKLLKIKNVLARAGLGLGLSITSGLLLSFLNPSWGLSTGLLCLLLFAIVNVIYIGRELKSFPKRKRSYERKRQDYLIERELYFEKLNIFPNQQKQYQEAVEAYKVEQKNWQEKIRKSREPLMRILNQTRPPDGDGSQARKGFSEKHLEPYLHRYFSDKIHTDLRIQNPSYDRGFHYTPDFAYIDSRTNLHIDIEIDEPYRYNSHQPLHCIGQDKERDQFFTDSHWVIIRFSEEQFVKYPESCCQKIAEVIAEVMSDESILKNFANVPPLPSMPQWTAEQAKQMARRSYRQTYLRS